MDMSGPSFTTVLGLDPGSRTAGYAFIRARVSEPRLPRDFAVLDAGVLRADADLPISTRIALMHDAIHGLMDQHRPAVLVLEKAFVDKNVSTALKLGEVRGAFIAAAGRLGIRVEEITPAEVKKTIAGTGAAAKEQVSLALRALMGFDRGASPHDVTDALAISLCYGLKLATKWTASSAVAKEMTR
jgi:crossover junction endodeoxyribonuclease RuvC